MNTKAYSKSFKIFGSSNNNSSINSNYISDNNFLFDKYVFLFDRIQTLEEIEKIVKNKFVYINPDIIECDINLSKDIFLIPRDPNNNLGLYINNTLHINRDLTCILHIMINYKWCTENSVGKFVVDFAHNETYSKFIAGYDSIANKTNNFKTVIPLRLLKNDTVSFCITNFKSTLLIENIMIIFEEI